MHDIMFPYEEITLNIMEVGHLMNSPHHSASRFRIRLPKLMPGIQGGTPKTWKLTTKTGIIKNSADCQVSINRNLVAKNYLDVARMPDKAFWARSDSNGYLAVGTKLRVVCMNNNPRALMIDSTIGGL